MKTLLVTGCTDVKTRVSAMANIGLFLAQAGDRVAFTSTVRNAFELDLLLWEEDERAVLRSRGMDGLLDLVTEYRDALMASEWADAPAADGMPACSYGTLRLRLPSSVLQALPSGSEPGRHITLLRGGPRRFSTDAPREGRDPHVDWPDFWSNCAGAAFFEHIQADLARAHDWLLLDTDPAVDLDLTLQIAPMADVVLLLSDYTEGAKAEAYHLATALRELGDLRAAILPCPSSVHADELEILHKRREHFQKHFSLFVPAALGPYWFVQAELPYVSYYQARSLLLCRQDLSQVHMPLYSAYYFLSETVRTVAASVPPPDEARPLSERFAEAARRARWDVFISYSSHDQQAAASLRTWLRKHEVRAFLSADDLTIEIGSRKWLQAIESVLARSGVLVLLLTGSACQSEWVRHEIDTFAQHGRLIVPVRIDDCAAPESIAQYQIVPWDGSASSTEMLKAIYRLIMGGLSSSWSASV